MNQGPPAPPHPIAHNENVWKSMIFNDSWVAKADHPTTETMQMHGNHYIFNESGAAHAPSPHCPHNENAWKSIDFRSFLGRQGAHPTAETMQRL